VVLLEKEERVKGIVFDCDGVLFESRRANLEYYNTVLERFSIGPIPADDDRAQLCHTAASPDVFRTLLGEENVAPALAIANSLDYREFIPYMIPADNLHEVLAAFASSCPLAVATNRGNSVVEILCHFDLESYFDVVVTSKDVSRPKPYPDMLNLASTELGMAIPDLLFVGDSELDLKAAQSAGMAFVAFGGRFPGVPTVHSHRELLAWHEKNR